MSDDYKKRNKIVKLLFQLGFVEHHMLAHDGVVFPERELFRLLLGILFSDIVIAGVGRACELDEDDVLFSHKSTLLWGLRGRKHSCISPPVKTISLTFGPGSPLSGL